MSDVTWTPGTWEDGVTKMQDRIRELEQDKDDLLAQRKRETDTWDCLENPGRLLLETTRERDALKLERNDLLAALESVANVGDRSAALIAEQAIARIKNPEGG